MRWPVKRQQILWSERHVLGALVRISEAGKKKKKIHYVKTAHVKVTRTEVKVCVLRENKKNGCPEMTNDLASKHTQKYNIKVEI